MRVLHVTDTHLGAALAVRNAPRGYKRADDHLRAFRAAVAPVFAGEVDAVVHSGDLFDRSSPPEEAIAAARAVFAELAARVPVAVIAGNHDRHGIRKSLGALPGVEIADTACVLALGGLRFGVLPYLRSAERWALEARRLAEAGVDALVAHQSFHGARVPGHVFYAGDHSETVSAEQIPPGITHILCGHLHPRQVVHLGGAAVVQPGSTERTSFREGPAPKGAAVWEFGAAITWRFFDVPSRPRVTLRAEPDLAAIAPGTLVSAYRASEPLIRAAAARGAYLLGRPEVVPRPQQLALFAPA